MIVSALGVVGLIALVFGNQWLYQSLYENNVFSYRSGPGRLISWLSFPQWRITPVRAGYLVPADLSLIALLAALGLFILVAARSLEPRQGAVGAFVVGWWATMAAAGVAGLVRAVLQITLNDYPGFEVWDLTFSAILAGAGFGLFFGWLPGLATVIAFLVTRPKGFAAEAQGVPGAFGPGRIGTGPMPQPAAPVRPPYAQQQQASGWAPVPSPPTPGPTGPQPAPGVPPGPAWASQPPPGGFQSAPAGYQPPPPAGYAPQPPPGYQPAPPPQVPLGTPAERPEPVESPEPAESGEPARSAESAGQSEPADSPEPVVPPVADESLEPAVQAEFGDRPDSEAPERADDPPRR
ncbi:MAG: hypothetical protein JWN52_3817 [Actinomycetia bacterium]|nr:hypothetical protein [Actinomycetes bacterium]